LADLLAKAQNFDFEKLRKGKESTSTKFLPSQKFVWSPPRGFACWQNIAPAFESCTQAKQFTCSFPRSLCSLRRVWDEVGTYLASPISLY